MANTHNTLNELFVDIADTIRAKKNSTDVIVADSFPSEIEALRIGFDYNNQNVTNISDYEFKNCEDLKSIDCYNLTNIGAGAFEGCSNLKSVILYDGVESVGENAFKGCKNVIIYYKGTNIPDSWNENFNPDNRPMLCGEPVEIWDISATEKDDVTAELYSAGVDNKYTLYIYGNGKMNDYEYEGAPWYNNFKFNILNIIISDSVTNIGSAAFHNCMYLTSIIIPNSVTSIGDYAFYGCRLTSITIPNSVNSIGYSAFYGCMLKTAGLIGGGYDYEFGWTNKIPNKAFYGCNNLISITIPNSITNIGDDVFSNCKSLTSIIIPNDVTKIGQSIFNNCTSLISITISNRVTNIYAYTFSGCTSLTSITIPDSVTNISYGAFQRCTSLTSITIPDSITNIGNHTFSGCTSLTSITYTGTIAQWNVITFDINWNYNTGSYTIHCTDGDIAKDGTITYYENNIGEGDV